MITNTTLQFTSYVDDLLTSLSNTPVDYPFLTPLRPVEPNWIRNTRSTTFRCGVRECRASKEPDARRRRRNNICSDTILNSRTFNVVTLDRK